VAKRVGAEAIKAGMIKKGCAFSKYKHNNDPDRLNLLIEKMRWEPKYFDQI
jgi:malate dehydrogenase (oxaloacetate-decarboxylating)